MKLYKFGQVGGGKCSLCGSEGFNKSTCPLNPLAKNKDPSKHPLAKLLTTSNKQKQKRETKKEDKQKNAPKEEKGDDTFEVNFVNFENSSKKIRVECLKGAELKRLLGKGGFGMVYQVCPINKDCEYVIKIQDLEYSEDTFDNEVKYVKILSNHNIGPKYIMSWKCDDIGFIITEKWHTELILYKGECIEEKLINKLENQINELHKLGYIHADISEKNILVKYRDISNDIRDITLTDFGSLDTIENWKKNQFNIVEKYYYYQNFDEMNTKFYYIDNNISLEDVKADPLHLDKSFIYYLRKMCKNKK